MKRASNFLRFLSGAKNFKLATLNLKLFLLLLFCAFSLFSLSLPAHAATINLPRTGQTTSYAAGDDGAIRAGVAWPNPRFTVSGDCITDNLTGLMWAKNANMPNGSRTWQGALDYVDSINSGAGLCGYNDWRLPQINELESLVHAGQSTTATWLNSQGFSNVKYAGQYYWSSTTSGGGTGSAWIIDYGYDYTIGSPKTNNYYVWPVRAGQTGAFGNSYIWKTGQTTSYATGDDGDLEMGAAWPSPRFTDNGNGTVTDNLTGLIWLKNANCFGTRSWTNALNDANTLSSGECGLSDGSAEGDWRLPNRKELRSLIDHSKEGPVLPTGHPFTNVQPDYYYWSSTSRAFAANNAWRIYIWGGNIDYIDKSFFDIDHVWPVQGGQFYNLNISKNGTGGFGTVTSVPAGISCGADCSEPYSSGASVTLTATADTGSTFAGWSGDADCSDGTVAMDANKTCTANFAGIPNISSSTASLNFGSVTVNTTSTSQTVTVTNVGTANLSISVVTLTGANSSEYTKQVDTCSGNTVAPTQNCQIQIAFMPASAGAKTGTLSITSDDPDTPTLNIPLSGIGIQQSIQSEVEVVLSCQTNVTAGNALTVTVKLYNYDCTNSVSVNRLMTQLMGNSSGTLFGLGIWGPYNKWIAAKTVSAATCDEFGNVTTPGTVLPFSITIINPVPTSLSGKMSEVTVDAITSKGESIGSGSCMVNVQ